MKKSVPLWPRKMKLRMLLKVSHTFKVIGTITISSMVHGERVDAVFSRGGREHQDGIKINMSIQRFQTIRSFPYASSNYACVQ